MVSVDVKKPRTEGEILKACMQVLIFIGLSNSIEIVWLRGRFLSPLTGVAENIFGLSEPPEEPKNEKYFFTSAVEFLHELIDIKIEIENK